MLHSTFVPIALLAGAALLPAQSDDFRLQTVLPARARLAEGNDSSQFPFGGAPRRIQIAYGRDTLDQDGPVAMRGIAFRPDGPLAAVMLGSWNVSVDVSTCPGSPTQLSRTFDDNHGPDRSQVFNGLVQATPRSLGAPPHRSEVRIYFFPTFTWEPRCGPLLLDFRVQSASGAALFCDAVTDGSESYGLIANTSSAGSTTANYPASGVDRRAPVLDLLIDTIGAPSVIAHPAGSALPWNIQPNTGTRAMYVYGPAAVGFSEARRITRLGWRIPASATHRARVYDIKVSLSTGAPNLPQNMSTTFGQNHGNDEMVVYDGLWQTHDFSATASVSGFEASIPLMREFEYDPELGSLVVDLQVRNVTGPTSTAFEGEPTGNPDVARIANTANALATTATFGPQNFALTLGIGSTSSPVLPPNGSSGLSATAYPWDTASGLRAQYFYGQAALGLSTPILIRHLSWRLEDTATDYGPAAFPATIDLSTAANPLSNLAVTFDLNHGADRVRAFDGVVSADYSQSTFGPFDFAIRVTLDQPFRWDPTQGPLVVDIRTPVGLAAGNIGRPAAGHFHPGVARIVHRLDPNATTANLGPQAFAMDLRLNGPWCRGTVEPYGAPCGGLLATSLFDPAIDSTVAIQLRNAPPSHIAPCGFALAPANIDLSPFGAVGCTGLTTGDLGVLWFITNANGVATASITIPNDPGLHLFRFYQQWLVLDGAAPGGVHAAGGLKIRIGG